MNTLLLRPASRGLRVGNMAPRQAEGGPTELTMKWQGANGELRSQLPCSDETTQAFPQGTLLQIIIKKKFLMSFAILNNILSNNNPSHFASNKGNPTDLLE